MQGSAGAGDSGQDNKGGLEETERKPSYRDLEPPGVEATGTG